MEKPFKSRRMMFAGRFGLVYEGCGGVKTAERMPPVLDAPNSRREIYTGKCQRTGSIVVWRAYHDIPFRLYLLSEGLRGSPESCTSMKRIRTGNPDT